MPISAYYGGHGAKVLKDMKRRYGEKKGERVFYATAKARGQEPGGKKKSSSSSSSSFKASAKARKHLAQGYRS
jgi:hypothetical protein